MSVFRLDDDTRPWWALAGACAGLFVLMLDSTVVALALPAIRTDIGATSTGLQWVMNVYLLALAVFVVTAGRLGDIFGRRRIFVYGSVAFGLGSALAGAAGDEHVLIAARAIQGLGGAAMLSLSLAIVCDAFPRSEQARALGIWAGVSAVALAIGPVAGGILVEIDWRLIFWLNLPVIVVGLVITLIAASESRDITSTRRVDLPGLLTLSVGLTALVLALVQSRNWGWASADTLGMLGLGVIVLVAFWFIEHRVESPIVDFDLFSNGPFLGASAAAFALVGCYWTVMFFQPQYLQDVAGHSPVVSGLMILPVTLPMVAISPQSGRLIKRFGARMPMTIGMLCAAAGMLVLTQMEANSGYGLLLVGYLLFGIALGLVYAPMSTAAMAAMPAEKSGIASGVLSMTRVLAGAVLLALAGSIVSSLEAGQLGESTASLAGGSRSAAARDAFTYGIAHSSWILVGFALSGAALTFALVRDPREVPVIPPEGDEKHHQHHRRFHL